MPTGLIVAIVIVVVVVLALLIWWISTSNSLKRAGIKVDESASGIDVALTKRFDLLTKSVAAVKGYAEHESKTLAEVTKMRCPAAGASMAEKSEFAAKTADAIKSINIVAEQYPDLKANTNFSNLQKQISEVEEQLQAARRVYNSNVSSFNQSIVVFPSSIVAGALKLTKKDFFEADAAKREDVKIEF